MAKKEKTVKCALIGYGGAFNMAKHHGDSINSNPGMKVVAACDVDTARFPQMEVDFPGIHTYSSVTKLCNNEDFDLAVIITPHNTHAKLALQCLESGRHVILEKPMCLNTKEATAMILAAKKSQVMLSVFHNRRWDGDYLTLQKIITSGAIGKVFHMEGFIGGYNPPGKWWRSVKAVSGGALWDWGAHFTDWMLNLMGPTEKVKDVAGYFHKLKWMDVTNEDQVEAVIRFESGAMADLQISSLARAGKPKWRILGTEGAILQESWDSNVPIKVYTTLNDMQVETLVRQIGGDWGAYYRNIAGHLLKGEALAVTAVSSRRAISVMEAAEKSAKSGRIERVAYP
jgi:predicted dehydrogenase